MKKVIIVGGGTAGSVIAKNLSNKFEVMVLEKSTKKNIPFPYNIPLMIGLLYKKKNNFVKQGKINSYGSKPVPFFYPNVLGGTSEINGAVHVIGQIKKWNNLLKRFKFTRTDLSSSLNQIYGNSKSSNSIKVKKSSTGIIETIISDTACKLGLKSIDTRWQNEVGIGLIYNTISKITRSSVSSLSPFKFSKVKIDVAVKNLLFDGDKVVGVCDENANEYYADYVILAGGVVGSSQILKNSYNISKNPKLMILETAGENIKDHPNLRINVKTQRQIGSLNEINSNLLKKCFGFFRHLIGFKTLFSGTGATIGFHLDLDDDGIVDTRINILRFYEAGRMGSSGDFFGDKDGGFSFSITPITPFSIGFLNTKAETPIVNAQHLAEDSDLALMKSAVMFVLDFLKQEPLSKHVRAILDEEQLEECSIAYMRRNCYSGYHLIGGTTHLVNSDFRLKNIHGCYVCDASVMEDHVSSNIHAAVVLLADMFSRKFVREVVEI